jgi:hypothetical protein
VLRVGFAIALTGCETIFPLEFVEPTPSSNCSTTESVVDDFEGELGPQWRSTFVRAAGGSAFTNNQRFEIVLASNFAASVLETAAFYDLTGRSFSVEVSETGDFGPGKSNLFELELALPGFTTNVLSGVFVATGEALAMRAIEDRLEIGLYQAGTFAPMRTVQPYDATVPQRWQIEQAGGSVIWSLDDGTGLVPLLSVPVSVGVVRPRILGFQNTSGAFNTIVDNVNTGIEPQPICGARVLQDDFSTAQLDLERWADRLDIGCRLVTNGAGGLTAEKVGDNNADNCVVRSSVPVDLHDTGLTIALGDIMLTNHELAIVVELRLPPKLDGNDYASQAGFRIDSANMLSAFGTLSPTPYKSIPFDRDLHKFLRLRAEPDPVTLIDQLRWETSIDGVVFDPLPLFQSSDYERLDQARLVVGVRGDQNAIGTVELLGVNAR